MLCLCHAEVMQLSPKHRAGIAPAELNGAKKGAAPDIEMSDSGSDSAVATYWGSQACGLTHTHTYTHKHKHTLTHIIDASAVH